MTPHHHLLLKANLEKELPKCQKFFVVVCGYIGGFNF